MIIDLASLGATPKQVAVNFASDEIDLDGEAKLESDVALIAEIARKGSRTHIRGTITANASLDCSRCLEPIAKAFDFAFEDVFVDAVEESRLDEAEVGVEHLDESLLIGGEIDLSEVVREQMLLALPEQVFCKEDCRGLCPICGGNRNLIDCSCESERTDPRWAALKDMK